MAVCIFAFFASQEPFVKIEKEDDPKAVNTNRLSLSVASDSKRFKRAKTKDIKEAKKPNPPVNTKSNTNWKLPDLVGMA